VATVTIVVEKLAAGSLLGIQAKLCIGFSALHLAARQEGQKKKRRDEACHARFHLSSIIDARPVFFIPL
jgi:hypothetical protein